MMEPQKMPQDVGRVVLVDKYATPLAIFLVLMGVTLSKPGGFVQNLSVSLLIFSIVFNMVMVRFITSGGAKPSLTLLRLLVNVTVNISLFYLLRTYWAPMWLLLVLTPVATAIYGSFFRTVVTAVGISIVILVIHVIQGPPGAVELGGEITKAAFILSLSLMVNEFVRKRCH